MSVRVVPADNNTLVETANPLPSGYRPIRWSAGGWIEIEE
jgi:hypothetical protein